MEKNEASQKKSNLGIFIEVQRRIKEVKLPPTELIKCWASEVIRNNANIVIRIVDEIEGEQLNKRFRGIARATNVLSFCYNSADPLEGDIAICYPIIVNEAREQRKSVEEHLAHMVVHGILHLQGFRHDNDKEAEEMEKLEIESMKNFGFGDPYV